MRELGLLVELPPPPPGKTGWPWTEESVPVPSVMPSDKPWPKVSIVTPSFNQGEFLEETIRSALLQNYPNLEYIIIDGGSTDNSVEIIKKYEPWLSYWVSEPDNGQADAISKGFDQSQGDIMGWLNSDDFLLPDALQIIAEDFIHSPSAGVIYGNRKIIDKLGNTKGYFFPPAILLSNFWLLGQPIPQECTFFRRQSYLEVGGIRKDKFFIMDYDLFYRMWNVTKFKKIRKFLGAFRLHANSKTSKYDAVMWTEFNEYKRECRIRDLSSIGTLATKISLQLFQRIEKLFVIISREGIQFAKRIY